MFTVLLPLALAATAATAAPAASPVTMVPESEVVRADGSLTWNVPLRIENASETGFYLDSLVLSITNRDPGASAPQVRRRIETATRALPTIGARDSNTYTYIGPAECEQGELVFELHGHGGTGRTHRLSARVRVDGGVLTDACPPRTLRGGGRDFEMVVAPASGLGVGAPGILLLPSEAAGVRAQLLTITTLAQRGYHVVALGAPGTGRSNAGADAAGPATLAAAAAALDTLLASPGVDRDRIGVWGTSRGATAALLLAARRPEVKGIVAVSAIYDWASGYRLAGESERRRLRAEAGADTTAWRTRSPLHAAAGLRVPVLVLHGEKDTISSADDARAFVARLEQSGNTIERRYLPSGAHALPSRDVNRPVLEFLRTRFGR